MAADSRRSATRSIATVAVGLLTLGSLVSCGHGSQGCGVFCQVAGPPGATPPSRPTTSPPAATGEARLGCGKYCQAAGILNGEAGEGQPAVTIVSSGTVTPDAGSYVPVVLKCNLAMQCRGSLVLSLTRPTDQGTPDSRSDLAVDAGATTTLGVRLGSVALPWLQSHGSASFEVIVDAGPSFGCDGTAWAPDQPTTSGLPACGNGNGSPVINGFAVFSTGELTVRPAG